jgi:hypothetical protein
MKIVQYYLMLLAFVFAGLSAMAFYGDGFAAWSWQVLTMIWIADGFFKQRTIDKLEKEIDNLKNNK